MEQCLVTLVSRLSLPSQCPPESKEKPTKPTFIHSAPIFFSTMQALKTKLRTPGWRLNFLFRYRRQWSRFFGLFQFFPQTSRDQAGHVTGPTTKPCTLNLRQVEKIIFDIFKCNILFSHEETLKGRQYDLKQILIRIPRKESSVSGNDQVNNETTEESFQFLVLSSFLGNLFSEFCENWRQLGQFYPQPSVW